MIVNKKGGHFAFGSELRICYAQTAAPAPPASPAGLGTAAPLTSPADFSIAAPLASPAGFRTAAPLTSPADLSIAAPLAPPAGLGTAPPLISPAEVSTTADRKETSQSDQFQPSSEPYHSDRLLVSGKPHAGWNEEVLSMTIEDALQLDESEFSLQSCSTGYVVMLSKPRTEQGRFKCMQLVQ